METGAVDDIAGVVAAMVRDDEGFGGHLLDGEHFRAEHDVAALFRQFTEEGITDFAVIQNGCIFDVDGGQSLGVRLYFLEVRRPQELTGDISLFASLIEFLKGGKLGFTRSDDDFAACSHRDAIVLAETHHFFTALQTAGCFDASGPVVDTAMKQTTPHTALMGGNGGFFLNNNNGLVGVCMDQVPCRGQPHNSASDYNDIVWPQGWN